MSKKNRELQKHNLDSLDLNLDNYSTNDIFRLFHLSINEPITKFHIQEAKRFVFSSHPDKSNLPSKYFCFFSDAFKILSDMYQFSEKTNQVEPIYTEVLQEINSEGKINSSEDFNLIPSTNKYDNIPTYVKEAFHAKFEREYSREEEDAEGYGSWLADKIFPEKQIMISGGENFNANHIQGKKNVLVYQQKEKGGSPPKRKMCEEMRIVPKACTAISGGGGSLGAGTYTADLFAGFSYTDLKYAYEENFLPEEAVREFQERPVFQSVDQYLQHRDEQNQTFNRHAHLKEYTIYTAQVNNDNNTFYTKIVPK